ncbi:hypothetical protein BROOK1789C_1310, partial [Bathymodiolus brooksi thiotrophic gill symbiont]
DELHPILLTLEIAINDNDLLTLRALLIKLVPEFKPQCKITDLLFE